MEVSHSFTLRHDSSNKKSWDQFLPGHNHHLKQKFLIGLLKKKCRLFTCNDKRGRTRRFNNPHSRKTSLIEPFPEFRHRKSIPIRCIQEHICREHKGKDILLALIIRYHFCDEHFPTALYGTVDAGKEFAGFFFTLGVAYVSQYNKIIPVISEIHFPEVTRKVAESFAKIEFTHCFFCHLKHIG